MSWEDVRGKFFVGGRVTVVSRFGYRGPAVVEAINWKNGQITARYSDDDNGYVVLPYHRFKAYCGGA